MKLRYVGIGSARTRRQGPRHSLQGEITMPIPQVNDRIKEAPAVMLRAVFAGVGQLLLAADKVRARAAETGWPPERIVPKGLPRALSRWHTLDDTRSGTVPLARERANSHNHSAQPPPAADSAGATAVPAPTATASPPPAPVDAEAPAASAPVDTDASSPVPASADAPASAAPAAPAAKQERPARAAPAVGEPATPAGPAGGAPPLPGYDDLSLPSLRGQDARPRRPGTPGDAGL